MSDAAHDYTLTRLDVLLHCIDRLLLVPEPMLTAQRRNLSAMVDEYAHRRGLVPPWRMIDAGFTLDQWRGLRRAYTPELRAWFDACDLFHRDREHLRSPALHRYLLQRCMMAPTCTPEVEIVMRGVPEYVPGVDP